MINVNMRTTLIKMTLRSANRPCGNVPVSAKHCQQRCDSPLLALERDGRDSKKSKGAPNLSVLLIPPEKKIRMSTQLVIRQLTAALGKSLVLNPAMYER